MVSRAAFQDAEQTTNELGFVAAPQFVLPNPEDGPAAFAQGAVYAAVAGLVALNLLPPEGGVGLGLGAVPGAAVPETAVHKHRQLALGQIARHKVLSGESHTNSGRIEGLV